MIRHATLALAMALAGPAFAGDWSWDLGSGTPTAGHRAKAHYKPRPRRHYRPRVMAYERREKEPEHVELDPGWQCVDKVRGLGTQWIGTEGALEAAKKDWMERVRYDHGESYIDMSNAKDFESRCGRVSIGEVAGQVTYRCEIMARPCKPPMQEARKVVKD